MTTEETKNLELFHYGVKGMKWGVRRPQGPDGQVIKKDRQEAKKLRKADRKEVRGHLKSNYSLKNKTGKINTAATSGGIIAASILGGPGGAILVADRSAGISIARSAGYSRGSSVAIGVLTGAAGGVVASEIAVRHRTNRAA